MIQWIKCWLYKYDPSSDPQHPRKKSGLIPCSFCLSTNNRDRRTARSPFRTSVAEMVTIRFSEMVAQKTKWKLTGKGT